jgi:hypothetical protein
MEACIFDHWVDGKSKKKRTKRAPLTSASSRENDLNPILVYVDKFRRLGVGEIPQMIQRLE